MSRFLALDYGTKRIGVAITDETKMLASPLPFLNATPFAQFLKKFQTLLQEQEVSLIVVGIPRNMDGSYGPSAQNAQDFVLRLKETIAIPIKTIDERLTTVQAQRQLHEAGKNTKKQKDKIDSASAQIILQTYLDSLENIP